MANYLTYPIKKMYITQSYNSAYTHLKHSTGTPCDYPIDDNCGDNTKSGYFYCPCDEMVVKKIYGVGTPASNGVWLESTSKVTTPKFNDYVTIMLCHPNDEDLRDVFVGKIYHRGEIITKEGNDGQATGYHIHFSVGRGLFKNTGWLLNNKNAWVINTANGPVKPEEAFFIDKNFTNVINTHNLHFTYLSLKDYYYVSCKSLNVHIMPSIYSKVINTLPQNTRLEALDETSSWIEIGGNQWLYKKCLTKIVPTNYYNTKIVNAEKLNVRITPNGRKAKFYAPLSQNTLVANMHDDNGWTMINKNRWVYSKYLIC
jgi:hypothetical protein